MERIGLVQGAGEDGKAPEMVKGEGRHVGMSERRWRKWSEEALGFLFDQTAEGQSPW